MVLSPPSLFLIQQNLPLFYMYISPVLKLHLNLLDQGSSESGNLSIHVQGAQDHCGPNAEALKIGPLKYCHHRSLRISRRNRNLGTPHCFFCINCQIIRKPLFLYTMLYVTLDSVVF